MKRLAKTITLASMSLILSTTAMANTYHTVVSGDSMWKIAVKYETGLSEIINANTHIKNPSLIYPGQKIAIAQKDTAASSYEKEVIRLVNEIRAKNSLGTLKEDWELSRVARYKSEDMKNNNYFSHTSPTYGSPFDMMKKFGISYRGAAENIAKGQKTPQEVVNAWMNSSGHRANILNKNYTHIGVGYVKSGNIWTQMFISK